MQDSRLKAQEALREDESKWLDQERQLMERRVKHQVQVFLIVLLFGRVTQFSLTWLLVRYRVFHNFESSLGLLESAQSLWCK